MANTGRGHGTQSTLIKKKGRITGTSQEATEESTPVVKSKPWEQEGKLTLQEPSNDWNLGEDRSSSLSPGHTRPTQDEWHHYDPCWSEATPGICRGPPIAQWYLINGLSDSGWVSIFHIKWFLLGSSLLPKGDKAPVTSLSATASTELICTGTGVLSRQASVIALTSAKYWRYVKGNEFWGKNRKKDVTISVLVQKYQNVREHIQWHNYS